MIDVSEDKKLVKEDENPDIYDEIYEDLSERMVGKINFNETNLKNIIYKEVIKIIEPLEGKGKYKGNAHHLTQDIVDKVAFAIIKKMDIPNK